MKITILLCLIVPMAIGNPYKSAITEVDMHCMTDQQRFQIHDHARFIESYHPKWTTNQKLDHITAVFAELYGTQWNYIYMKGSIAGSNVHHETCKFTWDNYNVLFFSTLRE